MRSLRNVMCGVVLAVSFVGVSSASAATWDPQGTEVTATSEGAPTLTDANGNTVSCPTADTRLTATGDLARTTAGLHNPVAFGTGTNCSALGLANVASVTTFGTWEFTATSTTNVNASATGTGAGGTGVVATITIFGTCHITINGPVTINNNTWSNANHTLTINNAATFPFTTNCPGVTSPGRLDGRFLLPSTATIT